MNWFCRCGFIALNVAAIAMLGCGSASNNDQGVSFTMLGYSVAANASSTPTTGTTAACSTAPNLSSGVFSIGSTPETEGQTAQVLAGIVVQNNLTTQFIRTQSAHLEFIIPGAQIQPPTSAVPYGGVVKQAGGLQCGVVSIVPPQVLSWISLNRASLPEPPFMLIVRSQITGTTQAGDVLTSNPVDIGFTVVTDNIIPPSSDTDTDGAIEGEGLSEDDDFIEDGEDDGSDEEVVDGDDDTQI